MGLLMTNMSINRLITESYHRILTKSKPHATIIPNKRRKIHESKIQGIYVKTFPDRETERIFAWASIKILLFFEMKVPT